MPLDVPPETTTSQNEETNGGTQLRIDNYLDEGHFDRALRSDVFLGLTQTPKKLPPKWFYDDRGSELFEQITRLPEYYPTEAERSILKTYAGEIAEASGADTLVELGSGAADKTRVLLDAMSAAGNLTRFVPFDVSEGILRSSSADLLNEYPGITISGVVGDFENHLRHIPLVGTKLTALLGGTVGNFHPEARKVFIADIVAGMKPGDSFLLGTNLVKDIDRLELAYDDPAGITAEFNKNVLHVLNDRVGGNFVIPNFEHYAKFDTKNEWIDIRLKSLTDQDVHLEDLDLDIHFDEGEFLHTEISSKFRREGVAEEVAEAGLELTNWWTDERGDYALSLSVLK